MKVYIYSGKTNTEQSCRETFLRYILREGWYKVRDKFRGDSQQKSQKNIRFWKVLYDWTGRVTYMIRNINLGGSLEVTLGQ